MLTGAGSDPLVVDDSADTANQAVTLSVGQIIGLGQPIAYTGMATLATRLGTGNDTLSLTGLDAAVPTKIDGGTGNNSAAIDLPGDLAGRLTLANFQTSHLNVAGNLTGTCITDGALSQVTVGQSLTGALTAGGNITSVSVSENLSGTLNAIGNLKTVGIGGDLSGSLSAPNISSFHVHGSITPAGELTVPGVLTQLEIDGSSAGQTNVGSLEGVVEPTVTPAADGTIFSLTEAGVSRAIRIQAADEIAGRRGLLSRCVYDSSTGTPQAAVRVNRRSIHRTV